MKPLFTMSTLFAVLLLWAAGAGLAASADEGTTASALPSLSQRDNQAVIALLESAAQDLNAGRLEQAGAALERALRIEPGNAAIWHYLGQTRLHQGRYLEAESLAAKSDSLAGDDAALRARNAWLIGAARQAAGQNLNPTIPDSEKLALQRRLDEEIKQRQQAEDQAAALREQLEQEQQRRAAEAARPAPLPPLPEPPRTAEPEPEPAQAEQERREERLGFESPRWRDTPEASLEAGANRGAFQIPAGHRPPPGKCRIWFPNRPAGHQPPPGDCQALRRQVPPGAWLVSH